MKRFVYQLVEHLGDPAAPKLSRNRNFGLYSSPSGKRALKLHRHLESLARDLERHGERAKLQVEAQPNGVRVVLEIPALKLVRTALLTDDDVDVMSRRPGKFAEALAPFVRSVTPA